MINTHLFLKAKYIIVWDGEQHRQYKNCCLEISNGTIVQVHSKIPSGPYIEDLGNCAIVPGFINLHCHPSETYGGKSYKEDCGNLYFYDSTLYDFAGLVNLEPTAAEIQAKLNLAEIIRSGCTTALIVGGPQSELEAKLSEEIGLRAYVGWGIRAGDKKEEVSIWSSPDGHSLTHTFNEKEGFKRIDEAVSFAKNLERSFNGRIKGLLAPTQTMTCTEEMLRKTRLAADKNGIGITIHGSEDFMEFETSVRTRGKTPVKVMHDAGLLGEDLIIAHCCSITGHSQINMRGNDLELLGDSRSTLAHCPYVLVREGDTLETFEKYKEANMNIGIGTDTFPSDYIQEMRWVAALGKITGRSTFSISAKDVFYAATINGAKAFGRTDIGRIAEGAKADFSVIRLDNLEMAPVRDVVKNIIYSATRHSVERVYVDGKCILKDDHIEGIDEQSLVGELQELTEAAWKKTQNKDEGKRKIDEIAPLSCPKLRKRIFFRETQ